jgi:hypothetical protein
MKIVAELMSKGAKALLIAGLSLTVVSFYIPHTAVLYAGGGGVFGMMAVSAALSLRLSRLQIVAGVIAMASCSVAGLCYFWNARVGDILSYVAAALFVAAALTVWVRRPEPLVKG